MSQCRKCSVDLVSPDNWYEGFASRGNYLCKACAKAAMKARWLRLNPGAKPQPPAMSAEERRARKRAANHRRYHSDPAKARAQQRAAYLRRKALMAHPTIQAAIAAVKASTPSTATEPNDRSA